MSISIKYRNNSSDDYNLTICSFETKTDLESGLSRSVTKGSTNDYRLMPTYSYGSYDNNFQFMIEFAHDDASVFSQTEIRKINKWLTSNKYSSELVYTVNGNEIIYKGLFTNCQYRTAGVGVVGLMYTFSNDSSFAYKTVTQTYNLSKAGDIIFTCDSDCECSYLYPTFTIKWTSTTEDKTNISLTNKSDNSGIMRIVVRDSLPITVNCQYQIISDAAGATTFEDLGWSDSGDIYWLRLVDGANTITVDKPCELTISCLIPIKVGEAFEY